MAGFFAIGIEHTKNEYNVGSLWRSANLFGASFLFTIGRRYKHQSSDTMKSILHTPLFHFETMEDMYEHLPYDCVLVGVELSDRAVALGGFSHPKRAVYLLGSEDNGLTLKAMERCHALVRLPGERSMNVAVAGSIVMYDRHNKYAPGPKRLP
jgi:tRNA G18 (ribose-2'-O)-methylase SpoU